MARLDRAEYFLLCALALVLPILEMPKNLILFLLLLLTVIRIVGRDITWRWPDRVETSLLFILAVCILSTAINWPLVNGLKGLKDTLSQVLVFWLIYRAGYSDKKNYGLAALVAVGVVFGLGWGIVNVLQFGQGQLQFHSAGIVSQSAIYLGVAFIMTLAVAWGDVAMVITRRIRVLWWLGTVVMVIGLFLMGSRGPIAAVLITGFVLAIMAGKRHLWLVLTGLVGVALALAVALPDRFSQHRALEKTWQTIATVALVAADQERYDNWRIAIRRIAQGDSLVLGIGPRNFAAIDQAKMHFDPPLTINPGRLNHAHNMFLNKLVEEGILGLAALLFFFWLVLVKLARDRRDNRWQHWLWMAGIGALAVPVIAGFFATPWYQEHALLAMVVLAMYLGSERQVARRLSV
ncbi:MAG: O-antigen ligase family protein [Sulfuricaulis sp.]|nr:O-antigen ligase family protein [Sulfuricaulis sp.]